jgi:nitroreductase
MQIVEFQPRPVSGAGRRRTADRKEGLTMSTDATIHPIGAQATVHALIAAADTAGYAPSIHDTQPWRWRLAGDVLDLHLDRASVLDETDADGRLATISCGAALHHARVSLAAEGWRTVVTRAPDQTDPDLLARLRIDERSTVDRPATPFLRTIPLRRTDRDPVTGTPVRQEQLTAITTAVRAEDTWLHVLYADEVLDLATAAEAAQRVDDSAWRAELAYWSGYGRPPGLRPSRRELGNHGELPTNAAHDRGATFALLYGPTDEPDDWLRAGEALSAAWLTATEHHVSVLPLSAPTEVDRTRQAVQLMIGSVGYPYLLLRLGRVDPTSQHTPRPPTEQLIERC